MVKKFINLCVLSHMAQEGLNTAAEAAGARGGPGNRTPAALRTAVPAIKDAAADIMTALEGVGLGGVWAVFAERPDAVIIKKEGGYEVALVGRFVKIRITTDEEFNVKNVEVEL